MGADAAIEDLLKRDRLVMLAAAGLASMVWG